MADQRIEKWARWVDGTIKHNVLTMHLHRHAWRTVSEILQANQRLPESYWWEFMLDTYATTQAVAVRRQADPHSDAASLRNLVDETRSDPGRLTVDYWLSLWGSSTARSSAGRQSSNGRGNSAGPRAITSTAIDVIGDVFGRYYSLLTASTMIELVPVIQHDWTAIFRVPWMADLDVAA